MSESWKDIPGILSGKSPTNMAKLDAALLFEDNTPAHKYIEVIAELLNTSHFALTISRDFFDAELAACIIQFVRAQLGQIRFGDAFQIMEGFSAFGYDFDELLILSPELHGQFKAENEQLYLQTVLALPIYHSEFALSDLPETVMLVRSRFVSTLDWKREPSPRVWMRFKNRVTESIGKKLGLTRIEKAIAEIHRIPSGQDGWAELENYLREHIRITYAFGMYEWEANGETTRLPESELDERIKEFLCN